MVGVTYFPGSCPIRDLIGAGLSGKSDHFLPWLRSTQGVVREVGVYANCNAGVHQWLLGVLSNSLILLTKSKTRDRDGQIPVTTYSFFNLVGREVLVSSGLEIMDAYCPNLSRFIWRGMCGCVRGNQLGRGQLVLWSLSCFPRPREGMSKRPTPGYASCLVLFLNCARVRIIIWRCRTSHEYSFPSTPGVGYLRVVGSGKFYLCAVLCRVEVQEYCRGNKFLSIFMP